MPRIQLIMQGNPNDHRISSDKLSDEEAAEQLKTIHEHIGASGSLQLPWAVVRAQLIVSAQILPDRSSASFH